MRIRTFSVLYLITALYFIVAVAAEVFIDDYVRPTSMFTYLLVGTILTGLATLLINVDIPQ